MVCRHRPASLAWSANTSTGTSCSTRTIAVRSRVPRPQHQLGEPRMLLREDKEGGQLQLVRCSQVARRADDPKLAVDESAERQR